MTERPDLNPADTISILIATDCHLGYKHSKVGGYNVDDTFDTFEEILQYAQQYDVDLILLGGDLFHDTKPTQDAIVKCMDLLRKYCLGSRPTRIELLSDPEYIFKHCSHKTVNYEDPNYNVSIPVFSIHGNHDDPSFGNVGSMDILSVSGLVNYFGKCTDLTNITIAPLIFKKGQTHFALYGLSYINDQRLSRLLRDYKIQMLRPKEDLQECFNMFVLHQNRVSRNDYSYIPDNKWPNFLNFIVWGHEHECRITPQMVEETGYYICQPGSSVATSLCEGESVPKHVGLLRINKMNFNMKKLPLKTVRPFVFDNLLLCEHRIKTDYSKKKSDAVCDFVDNYIESKLISQAAEQVTGHPKQPIKPLIRLRIFYTDDDEIFETTRLAQKYYNEVANPSDMIIFRKERPSPTKRKNTSRANDEENPILDYAELLEDQKNWSSTIQGNLKAYFEKEENRDQLTVLSVTALNEALERYTKMNDASAYDDVVRHQRKKTMEYLQNKEVTTSGAILEAIKKYRDERIANEMLEREIVNEILDDDSRRITRVDAVVLSSDSDKDEDDSRMMNRAADKAETGKTERGRGRGSRARGKSTRGTRGRGKTATSGQSISTKAHSTQQMQNTMHSFIASSSQPRTGKQAVHFIDDSD